MFQKFFIITTVSDSIPFFKGQLNILKETFSVSLVSNPGVHLKEMSKEYNVNSFPIHMEREISIWKDLKSLISLYGLFQKEKPTIVHGNTPKASLLSMIAAKFAKVPIRIYYVHGLRYQSAEGRKKKLLMFIEKISCYFATDVIAVSKGIQEQLKLDNITSKEIKLIWNGSINGIDTSYYDPDRIEKAEIDGINNEDFVFGFVGRIVKDKGIEELIKAFLELLKDKNNIKLLILGDFQKDTNLHSEIVDKIHNHPNIIYVGRQKDVRPFLKAMDIFVLPSYREGLCGVILESSAMKIPVIASDISGIREVVRHNYSGLLVPEKNTEYLKAALNFLSDNQDLRKEMATKARDFTIQNFEQKRLWEKTKILYKQIITNHV